MERKNKGHIVLLLSALFAIGRTDVKAQSKPNIIILLKAELEKIIL